MNSQNLYARHQQLRDWVGWDDADAQSLRDVGDILRPRLPELVDDFYAEIQRQPEARRVITGGAVQVARLKQTLAAWLEDFFAANFDQQYVNRRWQVGWRHVEIGLRQVYVNAAMGRMRLWMLRTLEQHWQAGDSQRVAAEAALHRALDLDLAIIQDAYEAEKHQRSEAAFRDLVEAAGCAIVILQQDHSIAYFNPFAERLTGYAASEMIGQDFFSLFVPPQDQGDVDDQLRLVFNGSPAVNHENKVRCHDGTLRRLLWNARRLDDFGGAPAVLAVGHDITDLRRAQERVLQAERLAAIGETIAGLAHESRNAFQRIQACLELLAMEVEDQPDALELVQRIARAQGHLHQLYEEVRSYAAPITLNRQRCDVAHISRDTWEHLEIGRREKAITLREHIGEANTTCDADPFSLEQLFRNVLENAIAACEKSGQIDIHVQAGKLGEKDALVVSVRDDGAGLPAEVAEQMFDPFFTTKTKGTGLGLAIVRRIVEAHGGTVHAGNHAAGGAEVVVALPRARP